MNFYRFWRPIRFWYQRRTRGWDDSDLWSLDTTIAEFIVPRMKRWLEIGVSGYPHGLTPEKWDEILRKILKTFELALEDPFDYKHEEGDSIEDRMRKADEYLKEVDEGLSLFAKHYLHLWD